MKIETSVTHRAAMVPPHCKLARALLLEPNSVKVTPWARSINPIKLLP